MDIDWAALSFEWRDLYRLSLDRVIAGQRPWLRVDRIYREALDTLLEWRRLSGVFAAAERDELNQIWTRLDPWPDSVEGLTRLRQRFVTSTLSNAGMAAVVAVVKHAGLPFDAVLTVELAQSYKPDRAVYQLAVDYLGYRPDEILMHAISMIWTPRVHSGCGPRSWRVRWSSVQAPGRIPHPRPGSISTPIVLSRLPATSGSSDGHGNRRSTGGFASRADSTWRSGAGKL